MLHKYISLNKKKFMCICTDINKTVHNVNIDTTLSLIKHFIRPEM